jgi:chitosanase
MIPADKKKICQEIINIFESGSAAGDYSNVTLIPGDSGGLTYGRSQTTLNSGNLYKLLALYFERLNEIDIGSWTVAQNILNMNLWRFKEMDQSLNNDKIIHSVLRELGSQSGLMKSVQDEFFDTVYWMTAQSMCESLELTLPLSWAIVYDGIIQGGFSIVRKRFPEVPPSKGGDERIWITAYLKARHNWLLTNISWGAPYNADDITVYRPETFMNLIELQNWNLNPPLDVQSIEIKTTDTNALYKSLVKTMSIKKVVTINE